MDAKSTVFLLLALLGLSGCVVKPDPISEEEHWRRAQADRADTAREQPPPTRPLTVEEAVARAVKYNLDHRLALMEKAFQARQIDIANLQMLPNLALGAGYTIRDNELASESISYKTRKVTLEPSVSSERNSLYADLAFSWSALDFGLSYFQAKQQADQFLILHERRRRLLNNLVKDVVSTYWRVATAERIEPQVAAALAEAERALHVYRQIEANKKAPLAQTLEQQRALIGIAGQLRRVSMDIASTKARLAALLNLPLSANIEIAAYDEADLPIPTLSASLADMENLGLYLRPDLREEAYRERIDRAEIRREALRMIPGIELLGGGYYDANKYLVHKFWANAGAKVTTDLLAIAGRARQYKAAKFQALVTRERRLAGTVAALVQIQMSYLQYHQAMQLYRDAEEVAAIEQKLLNLADSSTQVKAIGDLDRIRQSALAVTSRLERDRYLIEVFMAFGNLYFSVGGDLMNGAEGGEDLETLTGIAREGLAHWTAGRFPALPADARREEGPSLADGILPGASAVPDLGGAPAASEMPESVPVSVPSGQEAN